MKNYSIWLDNIESTNCKSVDKDMNTEVLIVGGGITGISTLYFLKNSGLKAILVERNKCVYGVTSRSTAKITYLQEKIYMNIRSLVNYETAKKYLKSQIDAVNLLKNIIETEKIDCDLKEVPSYLFTNDDNNISKLEEEYNFLQEVVNVTKLNDVSFDEQVKLALKVDNTYLFHPLKYINHLKNKFKDDIYEKSKVESLNKERDYYVAYVNGYKIKAKYIVIATHYPYFLIPFLMPFKSHIETSYIGAKKINDFYSVSAINIDKPMVSLRYHQSKNNNYLIYLYNSFISANIKNIKQNFNELKSRNDLQYTWSNKDIITNDYMPYIGNIYKNDNTLLMASGYNTWGMTNGTLAGKILTDIILGNNNKYVELFSPNRKINLSKIVRLPLDIGCNVKSIIKSTKNNVNNSNVIYKKINGEKVAIYKDTNGKEHIVYNRCPHMKCGIVFNEVENTWDCLCHGSRFDLDGKCIEGPSNYDISFK